MWNPINGPLYAEQRESPVPNPDRPCLILLHGFTQTSRSWDPFIRFLDPHWTIIRVDLPGHGFSDHATANLNEAADLIAATCGPGIYLGYSMGGRIALNIAVRYPDQTIQLALIGATPGIIDDQDRVERRLADDELADTIERDGVSMFIDRWLSNPMFDRLPKTAVDITDRNRNSVSGLANSLRFVGTGTQSPLWSQLSALTMPVTVIAGAEDHKFAAIGQEMATAIGTNAAVHLIAHAGHTAHLEQPAATSAIINAL